MVGNSVNFFGRFVSDPELTDVNGKKVCNFTLARPKYPGSDEAMFINFAAWNNTAEFIAKYFTKGMPVNIEGSLQQRSYEDSNGNKRTVIDVLVGGAAFTESKNRKGDADNNTSEHKNDPPVSDEENNHMTDDGDLPF